MTETTRKIDAQWVKVGDQVLEPPPQGYGRVPITGVLQDMINGMLNNLI